MRLLSIMTCASLTVLGAAAPVEGSGALPPGYTTTRTGDVPVVGGFDGDRGEFCGEDRDDGRPVKVRYTWSKLDCDHTRWEQAFSDDDGSWETNWTADFVRADPATTCEAGRPKRT
jgi:hypothetical protein